MPTLKSQIQALATTFAVEVVAAIRGASLQEILAEGGGGIPVPFGRARRAARPAKALGGSVSSGKTAKQGKGGRLARRSASDIAQVTGLIVAKLKEHKGGLRSEQLQKLLKLSKKEIVRPLGMALDGKKITKKGQKRSTTYFVK
jgi:hypothetical protein